MTNRTRPARNTDVTPVERRLASFSMLQVSARAAGHCPACLGAGRLYEANGDSNACEACDGTGLWAYWVTLTGGGWR